MPKGEKFLLITGGSRGIGQAITLSQAQKGLVIFLNFLRDEDSASLTQKKAQKKGARVFLIPGNVGDPESIEEIFQIVQKHTNRLDCLVHNAALGVFKPVSQLRVKDWDISLDVNAKALLLLAQKALPLMKKNGGKIVAISSVGSNRFTPDYGAIGISKAALENLVRYLAVELAVHQIQVNAVSGGLVKTDSLKMFPHLKNLEKVYLSRTPKGRIGSPEDIAHVVSFLLGPQSDWIAGQTIIADGGYSLT